jgi:hypothetical protein
VLRYILKEEADCKNIMQKEERREKGFLKKQKVIQCSDMLSIFIKERVIVKIVRCVMVDSSDNKSQFKKGGGFLENEN